MTERGPAPVHIGKPGQIPCSRFLHPCGPGTAGVYRQQSQGGPLLLSRPLPSQRSRVRGDPRLHSQLARPRGCHAMLGREPLHGLLCGGPYQHLLLVTDLSFSSSLAALKRRVKQRRVGRPVTSAVFPTHWPWKRPEALLSGNIIIQPTGIH